jgi:ubiquinone/menaquinone biosynthesis C-methylase UbiE
MLKRIGIAAASFAMAALLPAFDVASDAVKLIELLRLQPGAAVAEIGAGDGKLTLALARQVGPAGRVFSNELGADKVRRLREAVEKGSAGNVTVVDGKEKDPGLADACCDAIVLRDVYHHLDDPPAMNASFLRALRPGGRVAIVDFTPPGAVAPPGGRARDGFHGVTAEVVGKELKEAGFEIVATEAPGNRWFIVVAGKPDDSALVREAALGWTQAAVKQDASALGRFLADDLEYAHAGGQIQTKEQYIAAVTRGPARYESFTFSDLRIRFFGPATAALSGYVDVKMVGQESFRVRTLQVYVERGGQWQMTAHQSTRVGR